MEYVKLNGQFPKLGRSAVTLGKIDRIHPVSYTHLTLPTK